MEYGDKIEGGGDCGGRYFEVRGQNWDGGQCIQIIGLGTLYQHKFEHNSSPFNLSIIEHNSKMFGHTDSTNVIMVQILINTVKC